jgi:hypothetical protein
MKPASPELKALLATRQFFRADLYTFFLTSGTVLRYCGGDRDLTYNGVFYSAGGVYDPVTNTGGPFFDRKDTKAKLHQKFGVETDTMVFDVVPGSAQVMGLPFIEAAYNGIFDSATFRIDRVYMKTYGDTSAGGVNVFHGRVAEVDSGRSIVTFMVNSWLELLNLNFPRNLWQPGCINNLGDAICGVKLAQTVPATASSGSSASVIKSSAVPALIGTIATFLITFTSGALSGQTQAVGSAVAGVSLTVLTPFTGAPAIGDRFNIIMNYQTNGTVAGGSSSATINTTIGLPFDGYYDLGTLTFTSGVNNGQSRTIMAATTAAVMLVGPFPSAPTAGDSFVVTAGCNKTSGLPIVATCTLFTSVSVTLTEPVPGITQNMPISGSGIAGGTIVRAINGVALIMSQAATASGPSTLTFSSSPNGCGKFNNLARRRGFDFIPQPILAV